MMSKSNILLVGNCQAQALADCIKVMRPDHEAVGLNYASVIRGKADPEVIFNDEHLLCVQTWLIPAVEKLFARRGRAIPNVIKYPNIHFSGYHPDIVYARETKGSIECGAMTGKLNSAIALAAWTSGLGVQETAALFTPETFERLGYFEHWNLARTALLADARATDVPLDRQFDGWASARPFVYVPQHPTVSVLADIARGIVDTGNLKVSSRYPERLMPEPFANNLSWPVYPGIAERIGLGGDFCFRLRPSLTRAGEIVSTTDLEGFLQRWFSVYETIDRETVQCDRLRTPRFRSFVETLRKRTWFTLQSGSIPAANPYRGLPAHQFWRSAVTETVREEVDPVVEAKFCVARTTKVATAGSCFAQHIARALEANGFCHHIVEQAPEGVSSDAAAQFGVFSARYGNIYTARQLRQLIARACGDVRSPDAVWHLANGRVLDPFRPNVEPGGFADRDAMERDREAHLHAVREMLNTLDVFVFTLGLTESWQDEDGFVVPLPPGAVSANTPRAYHFENFATRAIIEDLEAALASLFAINPTARVILTVSPVPLVATYEPRHALVATTYSKAVLRVAAAEIEARYVDRVAYFPSYEIVTGPHARGDYFESDLRSVSPAAVQHVMRLFLRHYGGAITAPAEAQGSSAATYVTTEPSSFFGEEYRAAAAVFCDEEMLAI